MSATARGRAFRVLSVVCALFASACATTNHNYDYAREPDPTAAEYIIGPSDLLRVNVWKDTELTGEMRVRPDGTITVPLVGDIKAAGKRPSQVKQEITQKLTAFVRPENLQVTVAVVEAKSYSFTISGNAERPGRYTADQYLRFLDAMSLAGGPNRFAETERILIVRRDESANIRQIPVNYEQLKKGERLEQNIVVLPGDTILIP